MHTQETHCLCIDDVSKQLQTHLEKGLSREEARLRLEKHGPNELMEKPRPGFLAMLLIQFNNFLSSTGNGTVKCRSAVSACPPGEQRKSGKRWSCW